MNEIVQEAPAQLRARNVHMSKLKKKEIREALPQEKEYKKHDGNGLFLRVRPSGSKSWIFIFSLPGDKRLIKMTLGAVKDISIEDAREEVIQLRKLVSSGIDPRSARAAAVAENVQALTMQILFEHWIAFEKAAEQVTAKWIKRHEDRWRLHLKNSLGKLLARDVTRAHLAMALDAMTRKGIREETRKALTTLNLMLDYALTRNLIEQNPARTLKPKDFAATANRPRDRVLSLDELRRVWLALDQASDTTSISKQSSTTSIVIATAIKLLILTGARRGEVAAMRWDELNLRDGAWSLPAEKTKNRQSHTIYLSSLAVELIQKLAPISGAHPFVFYGGRSSSKGHIHEDTLTGLIGRLRGTKKGSKKGKLENAYLEDIPSFSIHDLRRSAATAWGEYLKIEPHVIERMLNHQPANKLVAVYQRAIYQTEQKNAWIAWGELIQRQIVIS
ncbi:site-specific integrase [Legionella pneumophila]|uniref:Site-specific integrase n=2 Tax=Legionella pneumophila TaxID=446 RepID=A0A2S6EYX5_LEGPN|nr:hypothetical protein BIZ52_05940 [Legionella pneumophila subsp. fraseri]AUB68410.1 hypothetical protein BJK09_05980 [Legionella pneumophila]APF05951.1 hypothetical protein BIZ51_06055 [Legionella pneumophila subsp. fraseri]AUB71383.1 hypothetical protein BJK08_05975 [Legionella pneumophila]KZX34586.1 hypothetical protein PtVFX2014_06205 [Legionella pneumophila]